MNFVEKLKKQLNIEFTKQDRGGVYGLTQRMMAYNSNKIEGSTLTEEQTASIFETGTLDGNTTFRAKDVEEMTGHFVMFNEILKTINSPLSDELIKSYHYKLKAGVFEDILNGYPIGEYKNRRNIISNITTALPNEVDTKMKDLITTYENSNKELSDIAKLHADFEHIHPFQDGNGRVGRILVFKECLRNDIVPVLILDDNKANYYKVLHDAQVNNNYEDLYNFFIDCSNTYYETVKDFLPPDIEEKIETNDIDNTDKDLGNSDIEEIETDDDWCL